MSTMNLNEESGVYEDEFVVEKILNKKIIDGKIYYYVKWYHWPMDTSTWEPIEHLDGCQKAIEAFEKRSQSSLRMPKLKPEVTPTKVMVESPPKLTPQKAKSPQKNELVPKMPKGGMTRANKPKRKPVKKAVEKKEESNEELEMEYFNCARKITKIISMLELNGEKFFLAEFENTTNQFLVNKKLACELQPDAVINYYETLVEFVDIFEYDEDMEDELNEEQLALEELRRQLESRPAC